MTRYHINYEGKVYPCRAKVLKCPYSESLHSNDKVELYYKVMNSKKAEVEPSKEAMREIDKLNRLKSLYSMSSEIEKSDSPVELITYTLKETLARITEYDLDADKRYWDRYKDDIAEEVYEVLDSGYQVPSNVPVEIARLGRKKFQERNNNIPSQFAEATRNRNEIMRRRRLAERDFSKYHNHHKWKLNEKNYHGTYRWVAEDFEQFSHDLNTSRMITQPIFYGDVEKSKEIIKEMNDYELLAAFDDYIVTDKEIEENVREANYFKYKNRKDLSDGANAKLKEWYDRNRKIYQNWKMNTPKRILLSMEIANELDRRNIYRQDSFIGKMLKDRKDD